MQTCRVCPLGSLGNYKYTVIFARHDGRWVFPRHRLRETFETAGGHIEPGETPLEGAKRELWEETGARDFTIQPVCDYWAGDEQGGANGMVFYADISALGELPADFEMRKVGLFDGLPEKLTYPYITPILFRELLKIEKMGGLCCPENRKEVCHGYGSARHQRGEGA